MSPVTPILAAPAIDGIDPSLACSHRPPCPGCPRFGEPGIGAHARDALAELARAHGLPPVRVISGASAGFRLRARLAVRGRLASPKVGLFAAGTHRVVHIPHCSTQHPLINRVASVVRRALVETRVGSYSDQARQGLVRHLQIVVERGSQTAQVVLVVNSATAAPVSACLELLRDRLGEDLHSLWFNSHCAPTNTVLGPHFQHWQGPPAVVDRFGGAEVHYPPGAFGQSNPQIAEQLIETVAAQIPAGARVAEFYAGVGAIGLSVLTRAAEVRMNEVNPHSLHGLELGIARLDPVVRAKVAVFPGAAGAALAAASGAQVVIADPPRKGLDRELTEHLRNHPPERFVYVSCGLPALLADTARLTDGGALRLAALTAFNLMPFTAHAEVVARFERA